MQFSLFGARPLFDPQTLGRRTREWRDDPIPSLQEKARSIVEFSKEVQRITGNSRSRARVKETELEQGFNRAFFVELLGYKIFPGQDESWTAWPKPKSADTGLSGEPDLLLGQRGRDAFETAAVVELQRPGTPLDGPQPSYHGRSPVEQAFDYASNLPACRWVIVTDMRIVRIYSIASPEQYHEIDLQSDSNLPSLDSFDQAYRMLAFENLIAGGADAPTSRLLAACQELQASIRDGFYEIYANIRSELLGAIEQWSAGRHSRHRIVFAAQRLLDRLLFVYFCEHHPDRLLPANLVKDVAERAIMSPGGSLHKVYDGMKALFHDLDVGVKTRRWELPRYNGELFKPDPILDELVLPDELHEKIFRWAPSRGPQKNIYGVYGLYEFDFWRELDRDLLGNLFERSVGDIAQLQAGGRDGARRAFGVYYTASRLARFAASSAIKASLAENAALTAALEKVATAKHADGNAIIDEIVAILKQYRIADLACGSGVFLTAALDALLAPYRKALEAVSSGGLERDIWSFRQSEILKATIFGVDILPQAVELAKLALWLAAARRNEPSADLSANIIDGNSLDTGTLRKILANAGGAFDLIVGNPPWGSDIDPAYAQRVISEFGLSTTQAWDSWEVFLVLAVQALKPGGRFVLLVPDTLFSADKDRTRRWLLEHTTLEKIYSLGPDWFTAEVRMGTVLLQGKRAKAAEPHTVATVVLAGKERIAAQGGTKPLQQVEAGLAQQTTQKLGAKGERTDLQVFASDRELDLLRRIEASSVTLGDITEHARGDEINAGGLVWRCGNCMTFTVPGEKEKGGRYKNKECPSCGLTLSSRDVALDSLVSETKHGAYSVPYVDGGSITQRYEAPVRRYLRKDMLPMMPRLKDDGLFRGPKILIRQAGVGIAATMVDDDCRCPQSVYIYRLTEAARASGYSERFVLGCLVSRTMNYILMKRFAEIDPARAFTKLTHARIGDLPIPKIGDAGSGQVVRDIEADVATMLATQSFGSEADHRIERRLRSLWHITAEEGRHINGFFSTLPEGQAVSALFPNGAPPPVRLQ